jgi:hypothetical protein
MFPRRRRGRGVRVASRKIRTKLEAGRRVLGITVQLPSPDAVEIAAIRWAAP